MGEPSGPESYQLGLGKRWRLRLPGGAAFVHDGRQWRQQREGPGTARAALDSLTEGLARVNDEWERAWRERYPDRPVPHGDHGAEPVVIPAHLRRPQGEPKRSKLSATQRRAKVAELWNAGATIDEIRVGLPGGQKARVSRSTVTDDLVKLRRDGIVSRRRTPIADTNDTSDRPPSPDQDDRP